MGPQLVEREQELAAIAETLEAARAGHGQIVVLEGPAGVGKTTLLSAAADDARALGFQVLSARAGQLERAFAFGICMQLFRPVLARSDAAALLAGPRSHARALLTGDEAAIATPAEGRLHVLLVGLEQLCKKLADESPLLLSVDDAHWADEESLRFVDYLGGRLDGSAVAVVLGVRGGDPGADRPLIRGLGLVESAQRLLPAPLSDPAVARLVRETVPGADQEVCRACAEATGGNPFYLTCVVDELKREQAPLRPESVLQLNPRAIADAVLVRAASLGDDARAVVGAVAVLGDGYPVAVAAELADLSLDRARIAADRLSRASILAANESPAFVHPIVREVVYRDLPPASRAGAHLRAARALAARSEDPEAVAAQLLRGDAAGDGWVVDALRSAARRALARAAPTAAHEYLFRALREPPSDGVRWEVLHELGRAEALAGLAAGTDRLSDAVELAPAGVPKATVSRSLAHVLVSMGRFDQAVDVLVSATQQLPGGEREFRLELEADIATAGRLHPATHALTAERLWRVAASAGVTGASAAERMILANLATARLFSSASAEEAAAPAEQALAGGLLGEQSSGSPTFFDALLPLIIADRTKLAEEVCDAALDDAQRRGSLFAHGLTLAMRSHLRWRLGDVAGAERDARESLDAALAGQFVFTATSLAGLLDALVERGQIAEADAALRATGFADEIPDLLVGNHLVSPRARVRIAQRRYSDALVDLRELHRRAQVWPAGDPRAYSYRAQLAEVLALLGERDEARWFAAEDLARANEWRTPRAIGIALRAQGLAAATGEAATRLLEESVEVLASAPAPLERARSLIHLGAAKRRDGDRTQARETLRQAIDLADRCGALAVKDWAALELNAAGGHLRRERLSGVEALTPAELRVAQLAADGLTNREIAQTLFLSPKTIEMHLHRTYRKLDLSSRRQLRVALAADHEA